MPTQDDERDEQEQGQPSQSSSGPIIGDETICSDETICGEG